MIELKEIMISTSELAELFDVSHKYISQLVLDHIMPKATHNKFKLYECVKWRFVYNEKICENRLKKIREENTRSRLERANAELKELELAEKRASLISADSVEKSKMNDAIIYVKSLNALNTKLPPVLIGAKTEQDISKIIKKETDSIRNQLATIPGNIPSGSVKFT